MYPARPDFLAYHNHEFLDTAVNIVPRDLSSYDPKYLTYIYAAFQERVAYQRTEGRGGIYNGVTIREIPKTERVLEARYF